MMDATMADRLIARRKAAGLSQEALADRLGVSRQAVSKWERVESSPDTDNLIALDNPGKGESVHVGPGGVHVDTPDDGGHSVHTRPDGGVTVDGRDFNSWGEAHDALGHDGKGPSAFRRG